jgi:hypothetical protein
MRWIRSICRRLRSVLSKESSNAALSEELQFHLARTVRRIWPGACRREKRLPQHKRPLGAGPEQLSSATRLEEQLGSTIFFRTFATDWER